MTGKFNSLCNLIMESPDWIILDRGRELIWFDKNVYPVTFLVIDETVIYSMNPKLSHNAMWGLLLGAAKKKGDIINNLSIVDIKVINPGPILKSYKDLFLLFRSFTQTRFTPRFPKNIVSGRFWKVDNGYISFWEKRDQVLEHLGPIEQLIEQIGFDPSSVRWELVGRTGKRLVEYDKYIGYRDTTKSSKADEERRAQEYALHTKAGMKRLVGKQNLPKVTRDIENRFLVPER